MDDTIEHLKLIQGVINRLSTNSFLLKGWTLTLSFVVLGFASSSSNGWFGFIGIVPVLIFWGLDAYYLRQEKLFRELYKMVRIRDANIPYFSMDTTACETNETSWCKTIKRPTIFYLYLIIVLMMIAVSLTMVLTANGGNNGT